MAVPVNPGLLLGSVMCARAGFSGRVLQLEALESLVVGTLGEAISVRILDSAN